MNDIQNTDVKWAAGGHTNPNGAAAYLGLSVPTLARWRSEGHGPNYLKYGNRVRYTRKALEAYQDSHAVSAGGDA